jgi:hypothetical protein
MTLNGPSKCDQLLQNTDISTLKLDSGVCTQMKFMESMNIKLSVRMRISGGKATQSLHEYGVMMSMMDYLK